jgi:dienelactone hydrolase
VSSSNARQPQQTTIAGEIPALVWRGVGEGPLPVLIYMHGGGHDKWDVDNDVIDHVPSHGVTLLSFDMYMHGERIPTSGKPTERTADRFLAGMERSANDLFTILDYLKNDPEVNTDRIGLRGYSHSANVALVALGQGFPVQACLSVAGAGDLAALYAYLAHRVDVPSAQIAEEIDREREGFMRINPLHHVDVFPPCAIMMIHGLHDVLAPFSAHFALYQALLPHYRSRAGDCLFLAHADGHWPPESVKQQGLAWLVDRLTDDHAGAR